MFPCLPLPMDRWGGCCNPMGFLWPPNCWAHRAKILQRRYDVIRGTTSGRFFTEFVFSDTKLPVIDLNEDMRVLGEKMTKSDLSHCMLTFQRSSNRGWIHTYLIVVKLVVLKVYESFSKKQTFLDLGRGGPSACARYMVSGWLASHPASNPPERWLAGHAETREPDICCAAFSCRQASRLTCNIYPFVEWEDFMR